MPLKKHIAKATQTTLNRFGYQLKRLNRNFDKILSDLFKKLPTPLTSAVIFDVGANNGSSIERFQRVFKSLRIQPLIYSFEPNKGLFQDLKSKYLQSSNVFLYQKGVGSEAGALEFFEHTTSHGSSSFLPVEQNTRFAQRRGIAQDTVRCYEVPIVTIDGVFSEFKLEKINLLKIDVQGFEEDVLKGCSQLLSKQLIDIIEVEVVVAPVYSKRITFFDIEKNLVNYGYRLVALSNDGRYFNLMPFDIFENPELQFDLIYVSPRIFNEVVTL